MEDIPKIKIIEALILGIVLPAILSGYTAYQLLTGGDIVFGKGNPIRYHGIDAYFVSLLYFGGSGVFFSKYFLDNIHPHNTDKARGFMYASFALITAGLVSAIVLA
ncbi:hypothetical protein [Microbulbifer sp. JMSA003]|uniref:hypothetical protein n=1 Tax=Microbulbifer sp. JMSA003 TaxID=3243369 RepID=UPI004039904A